MVEITSGPQIRIAIGLFVVLALVVTAGDGLGWFETPLPVPLDENDGETGPSGEVDLRATRAACRFGAAISRAGTRGRGRLNLPELADAYAESYRDLSVDDRRLIRDACLEGLRRAIDRP